MSQINWYSMLWLLPLLIGAAVAAFNKDRINEMTESIEARFRGWKQKTAGRDGFLFRYVLNPLLWTIVKFFDWTDGFAHRGLKNGVRVATTLYLIALWFVIQLAFGALSLIGGSASNVAFFAHVGGFILGMIAGLLYVAAHKKK